MKQQWHLSDRKQQSVIRNIFSIGRAGSFLPILAPISCVQAAPSTVHSFLPQGLRGGYVAATELRAEINHSLLSKPSINSRIPKPDRFCLYNCVGGEADSCISCSALFLESTPQLSLLFLAEAQFVIQPRVHIGENVFI